MRTPKLTVSLFLVTTFFAHQGFAQDTKSAYAASINEYVRNYVSTHEVVKGKDRAHLHFYAPDSNYRVTARFEKIDDTQGFGMTTSIRSMQQYYRYGLLRFTLNGTPCQLTVYQSKSLMQVPKYKSYLFLPFTDSTNGADTYEGGRYIDLTMADIQNNQMVIDFNKAYNPYCCYTEGYSCPVPPKENALPVAVRAGEQKYSKPVH